MGKYLVRVESMDCDEAMDSRLTDGIECEGFVVLAYKGEGAQVLIHNVNVDIISDMIAASNKVMAAGMLARGKRDAAELLRKGEMNGLLDRLLGKD